MILQKVHSGSPSTVLQKSHANLALEMARGFGNETFRPLEPFELMEFVVANHDRGWDEIDEKLTFNDATGLPYDLIQTPMDALLQTGPESVKFCADYHPYCGLLVSMHSFGLFTGRYGLSDKVFVEMVPAHYRAKVEANLKDELLRQSQLKAQLQEDKSLQGWLTEEALFYNYKRLQFFDTLSLYFNVDEDSGRQEAVFPNVPRSLGDDVSIKVSRVEEGVYALDPYPFRLPEFDVGLSKLLIEPQKTTVSLAQLNLDHLKSWEPIKLVSPELQH